jgi:hypothetical protein
MQRDGIPPAEALGFVGKNMRANDAVCVGICLKDNPRSMEENLAVLEGAFRGAH